MAQIRSAFRKAPGEMTQELNKAIKQSIFQIERGSKMNTPVATGRLRASHHTIFGHLRGEVGPDTNYALFVHEGTRFMKGRPFLLQAVKDMANPIQGFFTNAVKKVLDDIGRKSG